MAGCPCAHNPHVRQPVGRDPRCLKAHGAAAVVDLDPGYPDLPSDLMRAIVQTPADYPLAWLLAESHASQHHSETHLAEVAADDKWFGP